MSQSSDQKFQAGRAPMAATQEAGFDRMLRLHLRFLHELHPVPEEFRRLVIAFSQRRRALDYQ